MVAGTDAERGVRVGGAQADITIPGADRETSSSIRIRMVPIRFPIHTLTHILGRSRTPSLFRILRPTLPPRIRTARRSNHLDCSGGSIAAIPAGFIHM